MNETLTTPNEEYLELTFAKETATGKGLNNKLIMENLHDGTFKKTEGRIGITIGRNKPKEYVRPISEWGSTYSFYVSRGYVLFSTEKVDTKTIEMGTNSLNGKEFKPLSDNAVSSIIKTLLGMANQLLEETYTVKVSHIPDDMIIKGKTILDDLADNYEDMSVAEFNGKLKNLFATIPRRIDKLNLMLATRKSEFANILANEQEIYDVMISQLKGMKIKAKEDQTILEAFNLEWREVTKEEEAKIKNMMGCEAKRYSKAYRIVNRTTEKAFNSFCEKYGFTEDNGISHLFHGSRSENFWSIITNGLTINPKGVVITGKMFGNGTYFAPDACKSMGYTSRSGSRWANGSSQTGFLGIYKVATGTSVEPHSVSKYDFASLLKNGYHSVWCKRGGSIGLRMDEVVVYNDCQDTIEYLVEVGL